MDSWIASLLALYYVLEKRKKRRIDELLNLIEHMNARDYKIPMRQDDFALLEDEIYKLFIERVEAKEQTRENAERQIEYLEDIAHQIKTPIVDLSLFAEENLEPTDDRIDSNDIAERS